MIIVSDSGPLIALSKLNLLFILLVGSLALIHEGIERGLINQTLEEVTKKMRERKIWISDEIIEKVRSRARLDWSEA